MCDINWLKQWHCATCSGGCTHIGNQTPVACPQEKDDIMKWEESDPPPTIPDMYHNLRDSKIPTRPISPYECSLLNHAYNFLAGRMWQNPQKLSTNKTPNQKKLKPCVEYVVGFAFFGTKVLLIRKNRPDWQAGKLNGVGGHIEKGETPHKTMSREFFEEVGIWTDSGMWTHFVTLNGKGWRVYFFYMSTNILNPEKKTDETPEIHDVEKLPNDMINNLHWLIPLALSSDNGKPMEIFEKEAWNSRPTEGMPEIEKAIRTELTKRDLLTFTERNKFINNVKQSLSRPEQGREKKTVKCLNCENEVYPICKTCLDEQGLPIAPQQPKNTGDTLTKIANLICDRDKGLFSYPDLICKIEAVLKTARGGRDENRTAQKEK